MDDAKETMNEATTAVHHTPTYMIVLIVFTFLAVALGGIYMSGVADDFIEDMAKKFFKAKAKAEEKALEHAGSEQAQGFLKDQLKKNPVVPAGELNEISSGLGDESVKEFGKGGGLGKMLGK